MAKVLLFHFLFLFTILFGKLYNSIKRHFIGVLLLPYEEWCSRQFQNVDYISVNGLEDTTLFVIKTNVLV